jgi:hypothetical protein
MAFPTTDAALARVGKVLERLIADAVCTDANSQQILMSLGRT